MVCPLSKMYTLGSSFMPAATHAGGLRYHGMNSTLSQLYADGLIEATTVKQTEVFAAAEEFARVEGILRVAQEAQEVGEASGKRPNRVSRRENDSRSAYDALLRI